jgi:hypothetical protein|nr:MAG TPA: Major head protein [Caudoviricetes sp.]
MEEVKKDEKDLKKKVEEGAEGEVVIDTESTTPEGAGTEPSGTEGKEPDEPKEGEVPTEEKESVEPKDSEPPEKKEEKPPEDKAAEKSLDDKEKELSKREEELSRREVEAEARNLLRNKGLSEELIPLVLRGSTEETEAAVELFEKILGEQVEKKLSEVAKGKSPEGSKGNISKETGSMVDAFRAKLRG